MILMWETNIYRLYESLAQGWTISAIRKHPHWISWLIKAPIGESFEEFIKQDN
jgi:hypothetical protein